MSTVDDIVEKQKVIELEHTKYAEQRAIKEKTKTEMDTNKDEEHKKSDTLEIKQVTEPNIDEPDTHKSRNQEDAEEINPNTEAPNKEHTLITINTNDSINNKCDNIKHECALCKDRFNTSKDFEHHIAEHIEEIETMDIDSLKN